MPNAATEYPRVTLEGAEALEYLEKHGYPYELARERAGGTWKLSRALGLNPGAFSFWKRVKAGYVPPPHAERCRELFGEP